MSTILTIFVDNPQTIDQLNIILKFKESPLNFMMDGVNRNNPSWFISNGRVGKVGKILGGLLFLYDVELMDDEYYHQPDFLLVPPGDVDWIMIRVFLEDVLLGIKGDYDIDEIMKMLPQPITQCIDPETIPEVAKNEDYEFTKLYDEKLDTMFYEVRKPNTDLPYTTATKNYKSQGHTPFFTALFICNSWGVSRNDVPFLEELWMHLEMDGVFDIDGLLKDATEACLPNESGIINSEPSVYRRDLLQVQDLYRSRSEARNIF